MIEKIQTSKAPAAIGPYSQAVIFNGILYLSGQIPIDPANGEIVEGAITEQTEQVIRNISEVLKAGGSDFSKVIKTTCFLKNMADFGAFNDVYSEYFVNKPVRSCVEVSALPKGVSVEIEVMAAVMNEA